MLQNIGLSEYILIAVAALVLFGPDKMPEIGRKLGKAVRELRSVTSAFLADVTRDPEQRRSAASDAAAPPTASEAAAPPVPFAPASPSAPGAVEAASAVATDRGAGSGSAAGAPGPAAGAFEAVTATPPTVAAAPVKPHRSADPRRLPE